MQVYHKKKKILTSVNQWKIEMKKCRCKFFKELCHISIIFSLTAHSFFYFKVYYNQLYCQFCYMYRETCHKTNTFKRKIYCQWGKKNKMKAIYDVIDVILAVVIVDPDILIYFPNRSQKFASL